MASRPSPRGSSPEPRSTRAEGRRFPTKRLVQTEWRIRLPVRPMPRLRTSRRCSRRARRSGRPDRGGQGRQRHRHPADEGLRRRRHRLQVRGPGPHLRVHRRPAASSAVKVGRQGRGARRVPGERHRHGRPLQGEGRQDAHLGRDLRRVRARRARRGHHRRPREGRPLRRHRREGVPPRLARSTSARCGTSTSHRRRSSSSRSSSSTRSAATSSCRAASSSRRSARS